RTLTDVDVPATQSERLGHDLVLVLEGGAREVEVDVVLAGLRLLAGDEPDPEPGVVVRQERDPFTGVGDRLPAEDAGPEAGEPGRVVRVEAERDQPRR